MDFLTFFGITEESSTEQVQNEQLDDGRLAYSNISLCPPPERYESWIEEEKEARGSELPVASNRFKVVLYSQRPKWASGSVMELPQYSKSKLSQNKKNNVMWYHPS